MAEFFKGTPQLGFEPGELQTVSLSLVPETAAALDSRGAPRDCSIDVAGGNSKCTRTETYRILDRGGATFTLTVGQLVNGWHVDKATAKFRQDEWPEVRITAHNHHDAPHPATTGTGGNGFSGTVALPTGFGVVPSFCKDGAVGGDYTIEVAHHELKDADGIVAQSHDTHATETVQGESVGQPVYPPPCFILSAGRNTDANDDASRNIPAYIHHILPENA